ncbi:hypothetical protein [Methylobacterium sp. NEAU K]|uniref:hypothetical protein n=1 Tax=Methylobacterium sp. NEAU K TaxID=3064946 RepID=UPI002733766D|nr:hypothetical protein [Methylobacterium sp. NEAU K]MDP4005779.1 hypothetical protein [Methylobacterium sp. NEAU K]
MTPDERARLEAWRRANKPGRATERAWGRQNRDAARWLDEIMRETPRAPTPDLLELDALRTKLRAHIARFDAEMAASPDDEPPIGGLFD